MLKETCKCLEYQSKHKDDILTTLEDENKYMDAKIYEMKPKFTAIPFEQQYNSLFLNAAIYHLQTIVHQTL